MIFFILFCPSAISWPDRYPIINIVVLTMSFYHPPFQIHTYGILVMFCLKPFNLYEINNKSTGRAKSVVSGGKSAPGISPWFGLTLCPSTVSYCVPHWDASIGTAAITDYTPFIDFRYFFLSLSHSSMVYLPIPYPQIILSVSFLIQSETVSNSPCTAYSFYFIQVVSVTSTI